MLNIFPSRLVRTLRYAETFQLTTGAAGVVGTVALMRLTSLFDPNQSGVGHQPYGYDQLCALYSRFLVLKCKVTLIASNVGATADEMIIWKLNSSYGYLDPTGFTLDRCVEAPQFGTGLLGPSGTDRTMRTSFEVLPWVVQGVSQQQYVNEFSTYGHSIGGNPTEVPTLAVGVGSPTGTAAVAATVQIILDFTVECTEPIQLAQS